MRLQIAAHGIGLPAELENYVRRRAGFSLGRFAGRITRATIRLADVNGPRGGVDKCCDIHIQTGLRNRVTVRECHANIYAAVAFAADRAARAVRRQLDLAGPAGRGVESIRRPVGEP